MLQGTESGKVNEETDATPVVPEGMYKVFAAVVSSPGPTVSFSALNTKGTFRRLHVQNMTGKRLMERAADEIDSLQIGQMEQFTIPGNNTKVFNNTSNNNILVSAWSTLF